ncbi:hypothetical protein, partial [Martelella alba]|uniref:hypothetical protein n=1 Tax=Martelella alba TaxID=2590451 RepID=UPI001E29FD1A
CLAIDQIAQSGLSSLNVIYYSAQLFSAVGNVTSSISTEMSSDTSEKLIKKVENNGNLPPK